eukprot:756140-Pyramimonas_sp.AAC.1
MCLKLVTRRCPLEIAAVPPQQPFSERALSLAAAHVALYPILHRSSSASSILARGTCISCSAIMSNPLPPMPCCISHSRAVGPHVEMLAQRSVRSRAAASPTSCRRRPRARP